MKTKTGTSLSNTSSFHAADNGHAHMTQPQPRHTQKEDHSNVSSNCHKATSQPPAINKALHLDMDLHLHVPDLRRNKKENRIRHYDPCSGYSQKLPHAKLSYSPNHASTPPQTLTWESSRTRRRAYSMEPSNTSSSPTNELTPPPEILRSQSHSPREVPLAFTPPISPHRPNRRRAFTTGHHDQPSLVGTTLLIGGGDLEERSCHRSATDRAEQFSFSSMEEGSTSWVSPHRSWRREKRNPSGRVRQTSCVARMEHEINCSDADQIAQLSSHNTQDKEDDLLSSEGSDDDMESHLTSSSSPSTSSSTSSQEDSQSDIDMGTEDTTPLHNFSRGLLLLQNMLPWMVSGFGLRHRHDPNYYSRTSSSATIHTTSSVANASVSSNSTSVLFQNPLSFKKTTSRFVTMLSIGIILWNGNAVGTGSYGTTNDYMVQNTNGKLDKIMNVTHSYNFIEQPHEVADFGNWGIQIEDRKDEISSATTNSASTRDVKPKPAKKHNGASTTNAKKEANLDKKKKRRRPTMAHAESLSSSSSINNRIAPPSSSTIHVPKATHYHKTSEFVLTDDQIKHSSPSSPPPRSTFWPFRRQLPSKQPKDQDGQRLTTQIIVSLAWFCLLLVGVETAIVQARKRFRLSHMLRRMNHSIALGYASSNYQHSD